jgi:hypothetical protein
MECRLCLSAQTLRPNTSWNKILRMTTLCSEPIMALGIVSDEKKLSFIILDCID